MAIEVLHIAAHYGGGVGAVVKNLTDNMSENYNHSIVSLNKFEPNVIPGMAIDYDMLKYSNTLQHMIKNSDIVILHWYNHPSLYEFLITHNIPACRLIIWAHANNLYPPYVIPERLVDMCDRFIFTSPVSYRAKEYQQLSDEQKKKFGCIWSVADMERFYNVKKVPHEKFTIGYAGTIDFNSKLHPDFVDLCGSIDIPNVQFIVCSDGPDLPKLKAQVADKGLTDKFIFTGRVDDLAPWFAQMDVFGYPLYEKHYGTCEQVLGEAMASGIVPVVLDNEPEWYIAAIFCIDKKEYASRIKFLFALASDGKKNSIDTAKRFAKEIYSTERMVSEWKSEFNNAMQIQKSVKSWYGKHKGAVLFCESLGQYGKAFNANIKSEIVQLFLQNRQWNSETKGSVRQYERAFPEDSYLKQWKKILEEII